MGSSTGGPLRDAAQVERVEVGVVGQVVERDRVRGADARQSRDGFRDGDLERQTVRARAHGIDQVVKRRRPFVVARLLDQDAAADGGQTLPAPHHPVSPWSRRPTP
jgi:hypothetical protein